MNAQQYMLEQHSQQQHQGSSMTPVVGSNSSNNNTTGSSSVVPQPTDSQHPTPKPAHTNTFVHKLYNMVVDNQYQHLIAWTYTGSSFVVCNIMEFSRDVLPKHFKHNNFSSFVRQLNMYGFHKVNKSPRGHRTLAENQIWEFSHPRFLRDRPDLLDEIKRKTIDNDTTKNRDNRDLHSHMTVMQVNHSEMMQRINHLSENFNQLVKELEETRKKQESQEEVLRNMLDVITQQHGGTLPHELKVDQQYEDRGGSTTPSILITSPDMFPPTTTHYARGAGGLTVQTHDLPAQQLSSLSPFGMVSDDDSSSLYSPHSPHTPTSQQQQHSLHVDAPRPNTPSDQFASTFTINPLDSLSHHPSR
ncbi:hypothetical protein K492DRAFT_229584 [Lichtheimia hyalospora FSU 10163]|nr:hypothetical protein K492DRAFT_229584 [Lichtheimia hyalospora FSU 10163]